MTLIKLFIAEIMTQANDGFRETEVRNYEPKKLESKPLAAAIKEAVKPKQKKWLVTCGRCGERHPS